MQAAVVAATDLGSRLTLIAVIASLALAGCAAAPTGPAPEILKFELPGLDGKTVSPADFAGQVVLVDIWATWCKPCEASFPFYAELQKELGPRGFTVVAVSVDEDVDAVKTFVEERKLPFKIVHDPKGSVPSSVGANKMPTAILIARDGSVVDRHGGFVDADKPEIRKRILAALEAK